ncbi:unnamed protein product [Strongylus vulgaris]|uniref:Uncharacterized protein n=1 Tax=Strongylus vulgaris TaxID=40348 RepID=A0A3P7IN19_STRVU|nr:unnamed protein product [Strongylus vulgaris]
MYIQKFQSSANEVVLRIAVARAAVARGEIPEALRAIASIPMGAKLNQISNNKLVLEVLYDMLDAGEMDAIEKLLPYLVMTEEGTSLSEWHANPSVLARSRRACAEGKLDVALKLYGLLHPKFKNSYFEAALLDSLGDRLRNNSFALDDIFALGKLMETMGLTNGAVRSINLSRIQKQVSGLLLNSEKKDVEADERQLTLAARLISLNFPGESSKGKSTFASKYIVLQLQSELLTFERARKMLKVMEKEASLQMLLNFFCTSP